MFQYNDADYPVRLCFVPKYIRGVNAHGNGSIKKRLLSEADWLTVIRKYRRRHKHCQLCGPVSKRAGSLHCHEDWGYVISEAGKPLAILRRLQVLCNHCHNMLHGNYETETPEEKRQDIAHWLAAKNKLPLEEMLHYYDVKIQEEEVLSSYRIPMWTFDLSLFRTEGVVEAWVGSELRGEAGEPVITINGLHVPFRYAQQFSSGQDNHAPYMESSVLTESADVHYDLRMGETLPFWRGRIAYACVLLVMVISGAYYSYAHWNKEAVKQPSTTTQMAVIPASEPSGRKQTLPKKQTVSYAGGINCPIGTTRVISIGPDQLCCDASGTCNAP